MYSVDVERRIPHRISSGLESYTSLAASADGARLVATIANARTSLWRMPLTEDRAAAPAAGDLSLISANSATPRLGANFLLYLSWQGDRQSICSLTNSTTREIWSSGAHSRIVGGPSIAPNGKHIAFSVADGGRTLLYIVDNDGSHIRVVTDSLALRGNPGWAPDEQSIVSAVIRDGEPRLTRIFLNGDAPLPMVSEYSIDPVWSPDGRFLVYSGADVGTTFPLRAAAADGRPYPLPSVMLTRGARRVAFFRDSQSLLILSGEIGHKNFSSARSSHGHPTRTCRASSGLRISRLRHLSLRFRDRFRSDTGEFGSRTDRAYPPVSDSGPRGAQVLAVWRPRPCPHSPK